LKGFKQINELDRRENKLISSVQIEAALFPMLQPTFLRGLDLKRRLFVASRGDGDLRREKGFPRILQFLAHYSLTTAFALDVP